MNPKHTASASRASAEHDLSEDRKRFVEGPRAESADRSDGTRTGDQDLSLRNATELREVHTVMSAHGAALALEKLRSADAELAQRYESTRGERRKRNR